MGSRSRCPPGLEGSRKVGVGVGTRTINKLILKRDREFLQRLQCAITKRIINGVIRQYTYVRNWAQLGSLVREKGCWQGWGNSAGITPLLYHFQHCPLQCDAGSFGVHIYHGNGSGTK